MRPQLLIEKIDIDLMESSILEEGKIKKYLIKGPFIETQIKNKNRRIYPRPVVEPIVESYKKVIELNRAVGELNHPDSLEINPERICLKIEKFDWDTSNSNVVLGEAKIVSTPKGMIVRALMDDGIKLAVSSRGSGTLKEGIVQKDFRFIAEDIVWEPSAPNCFVDNILESKTEWILEKGILVEKDIEDIKLKLKNLGKQKVQDVLISIFEQALNKI